VVWVASILGGLAVILASLLALRVVVDRGWLVPAARGFFRLGGGGGARVGGDALRRRGYRLPAGALAGAGLGVLYGTLWAASARYGLVPRPAAFGLMVAVAAVAIGSAARHRDRFVAHLGLVGGLLTPVLINTGHPDAVGLFSYLTLLSAGAVLAASRRGWWDVVLVAALGTGALYLGWASQSWRPDQVPYGLFAGLVLALPFAVAAARQETPQPLAWVATAAAVLLPVGALAWVMPVDPLFMDPRSGAAVLRDLGSAPWLVTAVLPLLGLPGWVIGRRRGLPLVGWLATGLVGMASLLATAGWAGHLTPPPLAVALMVLLPLAFGLALHLGARGAQEVLPVAALPLLAGLAACGGMAAAETVLPGTSAMLAALTLVGIGAAFLSRQGWLLLTTLAGLALALAVASLRVDQLGAQGLAGPALLGLALLVPLPVLTRRFPGQEGVAVVTAALAGPALFLPLYRAWEAGWTDATIGLLPLLLALLSIGTAVLLSRARRVHRGDAALALFVAVGLLGISAAVPLQLHNQWLTLAWALEGAALAALSRRLSHPLVRGAAVALGLAVAVRLLLNPAALAYGHTGVVPIFNWTLYTWGVPAVCLALSARWLAPSAEERARVPAFVPPLLRVLAVLVGFALVQVEVSVLFQDAGPVEIGGHGLLQGMVRSLSWAVYGVAVLVAGLWSRHRHLRLVGFALVLLAAGKVFAFDLWQLSGFVRVGSVLGLGVTLLVSAFLFERLVLRADAPAPEDP